MHTIPELQGKTEWLRYQPTQTLRNKTKSLCNLIFSGKDDIFHFSGGKSNTALLGMVPQAREFLASTLKEYKEKQALNKRQDNVIRPVQEFWLRVFHAVPIPHAFQAAQREQLKTWRDVVVKSYTPEDVEVPANLQIREELIQELKQVIEECGDLGVLEQEQRVLHFLATKGYKVDQRSMSSYRQAAMDMKARMFVQAQEMTLGHVKDFLECQGHMFDTLHDRHQQMERHIEETKRIHEQIGMQAEATNRAQEQLQRLVSLKMSKYEQTKQQKQDEPKQMESTDI